MDSVGNWFVVMERQGELPYIYIGLKKINQSSIEWKTYHHKNCDGLGALALTLKDENIEIEIPQLEKKRRWENRILSWLRYLPKTKAQTTEWNRLEEFTNQKSVPAFKIFSLEETSDLRKRILNQNSSENSFLLYHLNKALNHFLPSNEKMLWWVPVNMRGGVFRSEITLNHSSYIGIDLKNANSPIEVKKKIKKELLEDSHWAAWDMIYLISQFGQRWIESNLDYYERKNNSWLGSFSSLGDIKSSMENGIENILFCSFPTWAHPVTAGVVFWNDKLGLTVKIHPSVLQRPNFDQELLAAWIESLLNIGL